MLRYFNLLKYNKNLRSLQGPATANLWSLIYYNYVSGSGQDTLGKEIESKGYQSKSEKNTEVFSS